jgi:hypothetical protein
MTIQSGMLVILLNISDSNIFVPTIDVHEHK